MVWSVAKIFLIHLRHTQSKIDNRRIVPRLKAYKSSNRPTSTLLNFNKLLGAFLGSNFKEIAFSVTSRPSTPDMTPRHSLKLSAPVLRCSKFTFLSAFQFAKISRSIICIYLV
jgi:hypothetical protein